MQRQPAIYESVSEGVSYLGFGFCFVLGREGCYCCSMMAGYVHMLLLCHLTAGARDWKLCVIRGRKSVLKMDRKRLTDLMHAMHRKKLIGEDCSGKRS